MTTSPGWQAPTVVSDSPGWTEPPGVLAITIGDLLIRTGMRLCPDMGSRWVLRSGGLAGWRTTTTDRTATQRRPAAGGLIVGRPDAEARQLVVSAMLLGATAQDVSRSLDRLAVLRRTTLTVAEHDRQLVREADVRITQVQETATTPTITDLTISMVADDPLRYSSAWIPITNGTQLLANAGDQTAWPIVELVGPHSPLTVQHPGGTLQLSALAVGVRRIIDCRTGALFNTAGVRVAGASGAWPLVPAGGGSWVISGLGAGSARVKRSEAWS